MTLRIPLHIVTTIGLSIMCLTQPAMATAEYHYKPNEYVTIVDGQSPNGQYAIASHGEGESGFTNFHVYLMDAQAGKKIGPLEEIKIVLDTAATAYYAKWSADSKQVSITYREERHVAVMVRYRIEGGRAFRMSGPVKVNGLPPH